MEKDFFKVTSLQEVLTLIHAFPAVGTQAHPLDRCVGRVLAEDIVSDINLPEFNRATMDGYAVQARSTFGASEGTPALFSIVGSVEMGEVPTVSVKAGEAVQIPTGGMLPPGADSVVMVEYCQKIDETTLEVCKSASPLQHVMEAGEDLRKGRPVLLRGSLVRPQELGVLAALGKTCVSVYKRPLVAIVSSGDEIVPVEKTPGPCQLRDVNAHTLGGFVRMNGGIPIFVGIAKDTFEDLNRLCRQALAVADMVLISGGSSVGARDFTLEVLLGLPESEILVQGVSISPGKPTILARSEQKILWGLPGQVTSAMIVFHVMVGPALRTIGGCSLNASQGARAVGATLSRNLSSVQGREDYVRVRLVRREKGLVAEPVLGKSGLLHTMVKADGLVRIDKNSEGLDEGTQVGVMLF